MTLGVTNTVALRDPIEKVHNGIEQLDLAKGDVIEASVVDLRETSISIAVEQGPEQKVIDLAISKDLDLNIQDQIEIEVLKVNKDVLELSIRKIQDTEIEMAKSHDPLADSINLDEVKKSIVTSNNPLQYSKQLDNHIEHAQAQVNTMLESFSDEEITVILKENYDVTKMTIDLLYQVGHSNRVDKKIALADDLNRSLDISVNDEKVNNLINEFSEKNTLNNVNKEDLEEIVKGLINNEIKPTPKNVEKLINFTIKVDKVKEMSDKEIIQFLSSDKDSSLAELHKSLYTSRKNVRKDVISEKDYKEIEADVKDIVKNNFSHADDQVLEEVNAIAKALVKKGIPIDERAIETIKYIKEPMDLDESIKVASEQIKRQEKLDKVIVTSKGHTPEILKKDDVLKLTSLINKVTNEDIEAVVIKNRRVSFHELEEQVEKVVDEKKIQVNQEKINEIVKNQAEIKPLDENKLEVNVEIEHKEELNPVEVNKTDHTKAIQETIDKNVENLQIIRYQMTYKAAMRLSIQGVDLKHSSLDVIRERIESFEILHIESSKEMPESIETKGVESSQVKIDLNESNALTKAEEAVIEVKKHMAIISSSSTRSIASIAISQVQVKVQSSSINESFMPVDNVNDETSSSLNPVSEETNNVSLASIVKAASEGADRYDQLRTMPRKDLGDNIEKAFTNVKDILADLKLEDTTFNNRAVEILGRNEMPITVENIQAVKELDIELQELFTKLMPQHVKELVNQNVDIINEPIENLVQYVRDQDSSVQKDVQEQVAKQIMAMLKNNEITSEQKDALIGVYRMIHTIESSKGAAVGFMLDNDLEVNLENLFDAAKVIRQGNKTSNIIDAQVNDSFGKLESINRENLTIKEQIQSGYMDKEISVDNMIKNLLMGENISNSSDSVSIATDKVNVEVNSQAGQVMTESITNDINKDLKEINDLVAKEEALEVKDMLTVVSKMAKSQLRENFRQNQNPSLNDLKSFEELSKNPTIFKDVFKEFTSLFKEFESVKDMTINKISEFMDDLTPKGQETFSQGMRQVIDEVKDTVLKDFFEKQSHENQEIISQESTLQTANKSIYEVSKNMESQLNIQKQLIENEDYYNVPVMINGEIQQMSMYYFRQEQNASSSEQDMSVYLSFTTDNLGTANIRVQLKGDRSNVTMYATNDVGNRQLKNYENEFKDMFDDVGLSVNKMKYDTFLIPTPVKPDQKIATANKVSKYNNNLFEKTI